MDEHESSALSSFLHRLVLNRGKTPILGGIKIRTSPRVISTSTPLYITYNKITT